MSKSNNQLLFIYTLHIFVWVKLILEFTIVGRICLVDKLPKVISGEWFLNLKLTHFHVHLFPLNALLPQHPFLGCLIVVFTASSRFAPRAISHSEVTALLAVHFQVGVLKKPIILGRVRVSIHNS